MPAAPVPHSLGERATLHHDARATGAALGEVRAQGAWAPRGEPSGGVPRRSEAAGLTALLALRAAHAAGALRFAIAGGDIPGVGPGSPSGTGASPPAAEPSPT